MNKVESRIEVLTSEVVCNPWNTSLRRAWMGNYLWEMKKDGIIEAWAWAFNETEFFCPMTKPPLSEGQRTAMIADYLKYYERYSEPIAPTQKPSQQILGKASRSNGLLDNFGEDQK